MARGKKYRILQGTCATCTHYRVEGTCVEDEESVCTLRDRERPSWPADDDPRYEQKVAALQRWRARREVQPNGTCDEFERRK